MNEKERLRAEAYGYIKENAVRDGEPFFADEISDVLREDAKSALDELAGEGKLECFSDGVYFLPYVSILGTKGCMNTGRYMEKKYFNYKGKVSGYTTGYALINNLRLTSQNPAVWEICSNAAIKPREKARVYGERIMVYHPAAEINAENKNALQFLDMMCCLEKYSEYSGEKLKKRLRSIVAAMNLDFNKVAEYLPLYPEGTYDKICRGGFKDEMV